MTPLMNWDNLSSALEKEDNPSLVLEVEDVERLSSALEKEHNLSMVLEVEDVERLSLALEKEDLSLIHI